MFKRFLLGIVLFSFTIVLTPLAAYCGLPSARELSKVDPAKAFLKCFHGCDGLRMVVPEIWP